MKHLLLFNINYYMTQLLVDIIENIIDLKILR